MDPMCGTGTLPIEAALIAADVAPGLLRLGRIPFGFERWPGHDQRIWERRVGEARGAATRIPRPPAPCQAVPGPYTQLTLPETLIGYVSVVLLTLQNN